jgi:hypothetical protein
VVPFCLLVCGGQCNADFLLLLVLLEFGKFCCCCCLVVWCCHCSSGGHNERSLSKFHKRILRLASQDELDDMVVKTADEEVALNYVRDKCMGRKMPMVLVGAEYVSWVAVVVVVVGVGVVFYHTCTALLPWWFRFRFSFSYYLRCWY